MPTTLTTQKREKRIPVEGKAVTSAKSITATRTTTTTTTDAASGNAQPVTSSSSLSAVKPAATTMTTVSAGAKQATAPTSAAPAASTGARSPNPQLKLSRVASGTHSPHSRSASAASAASSSSSNGSSSRASREQAARRSTRGGSVSTHMSPAIMEATLATTQSGKRHTRTMVYAVAPGTAGGMSTATARFNAVNAGATVGSSSTVPAVIPETQGNTAATGTGVTLRYRTDLDKAVIHFMFERLPRPTEEVIVPNEDDDDRDCTSAGDWHFFWMSVGRIHNIFSTAEFRLHDNQIINHFPNHYELTRKDLMYKNIKRYLRENQSTVQVGKLTLFTATEWTTASNNSNTAGAASAAAAAANTGATSSTAASPTRSALLASDGSGRGLHAFNFADAVPITYNIPNDMSMFIEEFKRRPGTTWIVKPTSRSQGKGIFLVNRLQQLMRWAKEKKEAETATANGALYRALSPSTASPISPIPSAVSILEGTESVPTNIQNLLGTFIVSKYIADPLLIGGKKFDMRLYCLVTSFKPLVAYLHEDGFARFCATKYAGNSLSGDDLGSHLTNVALQKGDEHYNTVHGGKWSLQNLYLFIQARYGAYRADTLIADIEYLIYHSLRAMENVMFNDKHSFELYGYDILIDAQIKPHLIEVNASPSLSTTTTSDRLMKEQVLTDMLKIVLPPGYPSSKAMPYWEYRLRTDLTTKLPTRFKLLQF